MIPLLTSAGAALNARDSNLWTPLMTACAAGQLGMATQLSEKESRLGCFDVAGRIALHLAAGASDPKLFIHLIDIGFDATLKDHHGLTPIHYCLRNRYLVSYVLNKGLDFDCFALDTQSEYLSSPPQENVPLGKLLKRVSSSCRNSLLAIEPRKETFHLCYAAMTGDLRSMDILLKAGVDVNMQGRHSGSALITACLAGILDSVRFLVRHGATFNSSLRGMHVHAIEAAHAYPQIIQWFLVGRYIDQRQIPQMSSDPQREIQWWSGVVEIGIPLERAFARQQGQSLWDHVRYVYGQRHRWEEMLPLDGSVEIHYRSTS
jgi:ankyrin repeat protein